MNRLITRIRCAWNAYRLRSDIKYLDEVIAATGGRPASSNLSSLR